MSFGKCAIRINSLKLHYYGGKRDYKMGHL